MDRTKFCKMLAIAKKRSKKSTSDICFDMRCLPTALRRIELGETNFQVVKCLEYLAVIGHHIELSDNDQDYVIRTGEDLSAYIEECLKGRSIGQVSVDVGCNRNYFRLILNGTHGIPIDQFLKFNEIVGCNLYLVKNG